MKKSAINFTIDYLLTLSFCAMTGIGLLLVITLPPSRLFGARGLPHYRNTLWGLDRHQWGYIHLIVAIFFLILLILHIYFHWTQIKTFFNRYCKTNRAQKLLLGPIFILLCLTMLLLPWLTKPATQQNQAGLRSTYYKEPLYKTHNVTPLQQNQSEATGALSEHKNRSATLDEHERFHQHRNSNESDKRPRKHLNRKNRRR